MRHVEKSQSALPNRPRRNVVSAILASRGGDGMSAEPEVRSSINDHF